MISVKEMVKEINIKLKFYEIYIIRRNNKFNKNETKEMRFLVEEFFKIKNSIILLIILFLHFKICLNSLRYKDIFDFLYNVKKLKFLGDDFLKENY